MATKYAAKIKHARKVIAAKGTLCTWYKSADDVNPADLPEFQDKGEPVAFPNIPIVFYPQSRLSLVTIMTVALTGSFSQQLYALIPGDVPFRPVTDDAVLIGDKIVHVDTVNVTEPDLTPIVYEVSFK